MTVIYHILSLFKNNKAIASIFLAALTLRLLFLSPWLEDWDSVQFALALHNFDMAKHQPHPPGYPLYILMGRFANFLLRNDTLTLTCLSAVLGAATAIPLYLLLHSLTRKSIALLGTILLLITPLHWTLSETALSNIPGTFFTTTTAFLLYKSKGARKYFLYGSFLGGLTLGIRFAEYSIIGGLLILANINRAKIADLLKSGIYFTAGLLLWLAPLIYTTGWPEFIKAYKSQTNYIIYHDSLLAYNYSLFARLSRIWELFKMGYSIYFTPFLLMAIWFVIKNHKAIKQWKNIFLLVWLFSYLTPLVLIYNLEVPRHLLPLLPPLVILTGLGLQELARSKLIFAGAGATILTLFATGLSQNQKLHTLTPPTISPVLYVKENFKPEDTSLITSFTYRQFQYYLPQFDTHYQTTSENLAKKNAVTDSNVIKEKMLSKGYNLLDGKEFTAPEDIFPRISKTNLYILQK